MLAIMMLFISRYFLGFNAEVGPRHDRKDARVPTLLTWFETQKSLPL